MSLTLEMCDEKPTDETAYIIITAYKNLKRGREQFPEQCMSVCAYLNAW